MNFGRAAKQFKGTTPPSSERQGGVSGARGDVEKATGQIIEGPRDDLCPERPWCLMEFPEWGSGARAIYCRSRDDRFKARRAHRDLPLFLRAELRTISTAVAGQPDEAASSLLRTMYRFKKASLQQKSELWIVGFEEQEPKTSSEPPKDLDVESEHDKLVERVAKALAWFDGKAKTASDVTRKKAERSFQEILDRLAELDEEKERKEAS